jgi:hypothetical protein
VPFSCVIELAACCRLLAVCSVREDRSWLPVAISAAAEVTPSAPLRIALIERRSSVCRVLQRTHRDGRIGVAVGMGVDIDREVTGSEALGRRRQLAEEALQHAQAADEGDRGERGKARAAADERAGGPAGARAVGDTSRADGQHRQQDRRALLDGKRGQHGISGVRIRQGAKAGSGGRADQRRLCRMG